MILEGLGVHFGSMLEASGVILEAFWVHFGFLCPHLTLFGKAFGIIFEAFWLSVGTLWLHLWPQGACGCTRAKSWFMLVAFGVHVGPFGRLLGSIFLALFSVLFFRPVSGSFFAVFSLLFWRLLAPLWEYVA